MEHEPQSTKTNHAYLELRRRLVFLEIAPGAVINESLLSLELGVGRTPIREALKRLETDHLVVSYARRGTFATNVDIHELASISEVRLALEPLAASHAATALSADARPDYLTAIDEIRKAASEDDRQKLLEYDHLVHQLIYRSINNMYLAETLERLDNLATRVWCLVRGRIPDISSHVHEHVDLLQAIIDRDADRAAMLAGEHVASFERSVREVL